MSVLDFVCWARSHGYVNDHGQFVGGNAPVLHYIKVLEHMQALMNTKIKDLDPIKVECGRKYVENYLKTA